ncbi:MAG: ATP-dependent helicase HrpB [Kiritimatiellae bacterium]|nr:ATP-dependent helicase HrpB [Kiritimatiellia bacterium]
MHTALPIVELRDELLDAMRVARRAVVCAPTGSGKSTQIPQMLVDGGVAPGQVVVLQPRRLAARLLAARVARERGGTPGEEVGYQVRFETLCGPSTRIRYVTEGVLLRQMLDDPLLQGVSVVIFDEFHERHLYGDVTLALALELQEGPRPDLRLIVMSATLTPEPLRAYLGDARLLQSPGRAHPVEIRYRAPDPRRGPSPPVWEQAADAWAEWARAGGDGVALIFMPGHWEIRRTIEAVLSRPEARGWAVLPLHGDLPPAQQEEAVAAGGGRRVIVATNVAETSITIEGVRLVVDSGLARIARYDPARGMDTLLIERISRAAADQRAGRAGRTGPGLCIRLWSERDQAARPAAETPEVLRVDLSEVALLLKAAGVRDLAEFRWLDAPSAERLRCAETLLQALGALDEQGDITPLGRRLLAFPVHPRHARMLLEAARRGATAPVAAVAAMIQGRDFWLPRVPREVETRRRELFVSDHDATDFAPRLRALAWAERQRWNPAAGAALGLHMAAAREAAALRDRFLSIARADGLPVPDAAPDDAELRRCVLAAFADRVARRLDAGTLRCRLVHGRRGELARSSIVREAPLLVAAEVRETQGREIEVVLSLVTAIEEAWLHELAPGAIRERSVVEWDPAARRVVGWRERVYHDLPLQRAPAEPDAAQAAELLAAAVLRGDAAPPGWDEPVRRWRRRVELVARFVPEAGVRELTEEDLRAALVDACRGALSARDLRDRSWLAAVKRQMPATHVAAVERLAPERVELTPAGRPVRVNYDDTGEPWIAATIQQLYGVERLPAILGGRLTPVLHVLAPNQRAVQITRDLAAFWQREYPNLRAQLARRYPKHEWR